MERGFVWQNVNYSAESGMKPKEAVDSVAERFGLYKDGNIYEYLLKRAFEEDHND